MLGVGSPRWGPGLEGGPRVQRHLRTVGEGDGVRLQCPGHTEARSLPSPQGTAETAEAERTTDHLVVRQNTGPGWSCMLRGPPSHL